MAKIPFFASSSISDNKPTGNFLFPLTLAIILLWFSCNEKQIRSSSLAFHSGTSTLLSSFRRRQLSLPYSTTNNPHLQICTLRYALYKSATVIQSTRSIPSTNRHIFGFLDLDSSHDPLLSCLCSSIVEPRQDLFFSLSFATKPTQFLRLLCRLRFTDRFDSYNDVYGAPLLLMFGSDTWPDWSPLCISSATETSLAPSLLWRQSCGPSFLSPFFDFFSSDLQPGRMSSVTHCNPEKTILYNGPNPNPFSNPARCCNSSINLFSTAKPEEVVDRFDITRGGGSRERYFVHFEKF